MRILMLADTLSSFAGWGSFSSSMLRGLRNSGFEAVCLSADRDSELPLPNPLDNRLAWAIAEWRLKRWMKRQKFDLVYIPVEPYAKLYKAFNNVPFVITMHGTYVEPKAHGAAWAVKLFSQAQEHACRLTVASEFTFRFLPEGLKDKTKIIPHGIDPSLVDSPFEDIGYSGGRPLIVSVGALKPRKGFDKLISGFSLFLKKYPAAKLVIVGQGLDTPFAQRLRKMIEDLRIGENVELAGKVSQEELLGWYRACDVFALTSVTAGGFEGFGLVYLEANLFGKPSVGNLDSGAISAIENGVSGYLVDPEPEKISNAIESSLSLDSSKIVEYAKNCSWQVRMRDYEALFAECVKSN